MAARINGVTELPAKSLKPYKKNAKKHSDDQVELIARSIKEFGFINPVLIDKDRNVIAGHGRLMAAEKLGIENVPCIYVEGMTEAQRKAYVLADNKLCELGSWDTNILTSELQELENIGFDIDVTGFDIEEINADDYGTDFDLPNSEKPYTNQITFIFAEEQKELIQYAMQTVEDRIVETFGNTNKNGNALYQVVKEWAEQRK